jgi:uncharacterized protein YciI
MARWLLVGLLALASAKGEDYCFGFLNAHPERQNIPEAQAAEIQKGHLAHMGKLAEAGRLLAAGPIVTPGGPRGILIYRCTSVDEAQRWTGGDPALRNKRLTVELYRWRGPDGIGEPLMTRLTADPDAKYEMTRLPLVVLRKTEKWQGAGPDPVFEQHYSGLVALLKAGKLRAAGPFVDSAGNSRVLPGILGLFIFSAMPLEEARALAEQDAMVRGGYARADAYEWMVADEAIPEAQAVLKQLR